MKDDGLNLGSITGALTSGLADGLLSTAISPALASVLGQVDTLGTTLTGVTAPVVTDLGTVLAPLPGLLSLMVNVQPDQACPDPASATSSAAEAATCAAIAASYTHAAADATAQYVETALRIGVGSAVATGVGLSLATGSAGPVTLPSP